MRHGGNAPEPRLGGVSSTAQAFFMGELYHTRDRAARGRSCRPGSGQTTPAGGVAHCRAAAAPLRRRLAPVAVPSRGSAALHNTPLTGPLVGAAAGYEGDGRTAYGRGLTLTALHRQLPTHHQNTTIQHQFRYRFYGVFYVPIAPLPGGFRPTRGGGGFTEESARARKRERFLLLAGAGVFG